MINTVTGLEYARLHPVITYVYHWTNGMVTVFDQDGKQIPEYQGRYSEVKLSILNDAPDNATFFEAEWGKWRNPIAREDF